MRRRLLAAWNEPLYRNSMYLILNSFVMALFGFVFWSLAARTFSSSEVGLATAVISAVSLVANISLLGFNVSILKFKDKSLNYTALMLCSVVSFFVACSFLLGIHLFSPGLDFILSSSVYVLGFIAFSILSVLYLIMNSILISEEKGRIVLLKDSIFSIFKVFLILFVSGVAGLLLSWFVGMAIGFFLSLAFISPDRKWFDLKKVFHFSFYNYTSTMLALLPGLILPLVVVHYLGSSSAAYFYIAWMIATLLLAIPSSIAQNLLSSGSTKKLQKAYISTVLLLSLGVIGIFLFGKIVLSFFGAEYVQALTLLYIFSLASLPYGLRIIYQTKLNMKGRVKKNCVMNVFVLLITLFGSITFIDFGFAAIGISWLLANVLSLVMVGGW